MSRRRWAGRAPGTLVGSLLAVTAAACGQSAAAPTPAPVAPVTVTEELRFSGALSGVMAAGDGALPLTHDEPPAEFVFGTQPPTASRCYDFEYRIGTSTPVHVYEAVVAGAVGEHRVALVLLVEPVVQTVVGAHLMAVDNTPTFPGQGLGYLWVDGRFWRYPAASASSSVVVAADGISGTAGFQVGNVPGGGASPPNVAVSGAWRCSPR